MKGLDSTLEPPLYPSECEWGGRRGQEEWLGQMAQANASLDWGSSQDCLLSSILLGQQKT